MHITAMKPSYKTIADVSSQHSKEKAFLKKNVLLEQEYIHSEKNQYVITCSSQF